MSSSDKPAGEPAEDRPLPRRDFLKRTAATSALVASSGMAASLQAAASTARIAGASDRIRLGVIGVGSRGGRLMEQLIGLAKQENVEVAAVCDVWNVNLDAAASSVKEAFGVQPRKFTRFGDLLALRDVDAVVIATPDFGHASILIDALEAGKDAYVEKPMALEIDLANQALDLARTAERVVQVGTQFRSDSKHKAAREVVASGVLGHISRIDAANNFNHARWLRSLSECKREDVDWDAYLFNRTKVPFDPGLLLRWQLYRMCTNGISGLWMSHRVDAACMITGATYPTSAVAHGGTYVWKENREHCDTFHALIDYPEEFLFSWAMGLANASGTHYRICGVNGTLDLEAGILSGLGGEGPDTIRVETPLELEPSASHMGNWLHCLRTRKRPNADIEFGHQHSVATIMAASALETGQRQRYDRTARRIVVG